MLAQKVVAGCKPVLRVVLGSVVGAVALAGCTATGPETFGSNTGTPTASVTRTGYPVVSVADGDTITVDIAGTVERVRLIGIDSPEISGPVECFGPEAADFAKSLLTGTSVELAADPTQDDRDRYGRLLRYVQLPDGTDVNATLVAGGYAYEYTYDKPYARQGQYRDQEATARARTVGLWAPTTCEGRGGRTDAAAATAAASAAPTALTPPAACAIKGNINRKGEKIFHLPGDPSYAATVISVDRGERYFCSVVEAEAAGWRTAGR